MTDDDGGALHEAVKALAALVDALFGRSTEW